MVWHLPLQCDSITVVRRLLSILLLLVFGLPLASPVFALTANSDAQLPACCRRAGKHHCTGMADNNGDHRNVAALQEKCPYCPAVPSISTNFAMGLPVALVLPALHGQSALVAQAQVSQRIAQERARHKRGPPASLPL